MSCGEYLRMLTTEQQEQFTQLWTQAQSTVACFVHTSIRDRGQAEDLLQEIAMTLLRKFSDYDPSKAFLPWAMGVAKFAILGSRRDCARSRLVFDEALLERISNTFLEIAPAQREEAAFPDVCLTKPAPDARRMARWVSLSERPIPGWLLGADLLLPVHTHRERAALLVTVKGAPSTSLFVFQRRNQPPPQWLVEGFVPTGEMIGKVSIEKDRGNKPVSFDIWRRDMPDGGEGVLGPAARPESIDPGTILYGIAALPIEAAPRLKR